MKKRAQSEIITTVLLVLIALAAVAIIAVFIVNQVRTSAGTAASKAQCTTIDLEITKALNVSTTAANVTIKNNGADLPVGTKIVVTANGVSWNTSTKALGALETLTLTGPYAAPGIPVEAGVILPDGTACPTKATATVTAA